MPVPEPDPMNPDEPVQPEKTSKPVKSDRTKRRTRSPVAVVRRLAMTNCCSSRSACRPKILSCLTNTLN